MTDPANKSLKALTAAKQHGPWEIGFGGFHNPKPLSSPGPVGKNDVHEANANGGKAAVVATALKGGIHGSLPAMDPIKKAVAISRMNFQFFSLKRQAVEVNDLFKELGFAKRSGNDDRKKVNSIISRLSVPVPDKPKHPAKHQVDLLHEVYVWADKEGLTPVFLAAVMFVEAHWPLKLPNKPDNFDFIGMDRFELELNDLIAEDLLTPDFKHKHFRRTGVTKPSERKGVFVKQIQFKNVSTTIEALAALVKHRRNFLLQDLPELGLSAASLSKDELDFWSYVYYNGGPKRTAYKAPDGHKETPDPQAVGFERLKQEVDRVKKGLNPGGSLIPTRLFPPHGDNPDVRDVAQRMLVIKKLLERVGMADPADSKTMKIRMIENLGTILEKLNRDDKKNPLLDL
jgi:hypothetical protein